MIVRRNFIRDAIATIRFPWLSSPRDLLVILRGLVELGVGVDIVLDPKLSAGLLQESLDCRSGYSGLIFVELPDRKTVQFALLRIMIEIALSTTGPVLASFRNSTWWPGECPGADLMITVPSWNTS